MKQALNNNKHHIAYSVLGIALVVSLVFNSRASFVAAPAGVVSQVASPSAAVTASPSATLAPSPKVIATPVVMRRTTTTPTH